MKNYFAFIASIIFSVTALAQSGSYSAGNGAPALTPSTGGPHTLNNLNQEITLQKVSNVFTFGDSYFSEGVLNDQDSLRGLLRRDVPAPVYTYDIPGATTPQYAVQAWSKFLPSQSAPNVSINSGAENDSALDSCTACANAISHYKNSLSALISWETIPFSNRQMASVAASTGTWTTETGVPLAGFYQFASPGTAMSCVATGCTRTFSITTTTATTRVGVVYNVCNFGNSGCGSFTVSIDGTNVTDACSGTTTFAGVSCVAFSLIQTEGVYRQEYTVSPATSHTIVFTSTAAGFVVPNSVDWIVPNSPTNNYVFGFATNAAWANYAAYNTAAAAVYGQFLTDGIPSYFIDIVNGVTVNGTTYTVNATTDLSTTATVTCSAAQLSNHPNTCGAEHYRQALQAQEYLSGFIFSSPNISSTSASGGSSIAPGAIVGKLSESNTGKAGIITAAATIPLASTYSYGGFYEITGSTTITTITAPPNCTRPLTFCMVHFAADSAVNFGTGGNIVSAMSLLTGQIVTMIYEQANPYFNTGVWYPVAPNSVITTATNCAAVGTSASPSVVACGAAPAGAFSCAVAASNATCTVNTTAVTAASRILVNLNSSEGTSIGVTCNTAPTSVPLVTLVSKTAGTGFTINVATITTNPACYDYQIIN